MKLKLLIFDLDGTIIDAYPAIIGSFNFTMRKFGLSLQPAASIKKAVGWGDKNLLAPFVCAKLIDKALGVYRKHHKIALLEKSKLLPYAGRLISSLDSEGRKLAVASNRPRRFSLILLEHLGIKDYFDYILCADELKFRKPHPLILNRIIGKLKINKENTIYIGDMALDAETGRRAGIKTIIVLGGSSTADQIKKQRPFKVIKNLSFLPKIIRKEFIAK